MFFHNKQRKGKIIKILFPKLVKIAFFIRVVVEGENRPPFAETKGGEKVKPHLTELQKAQAFDSYAKKTIKGAARDYYRNTRRRQEREVFFSELTSASVAALSGNDTYFVGEHKFQVLDWKIGIADPELADALKRIPPERLDIVLLSYFLDMNDREIAERLDMANSTVTYRRKASLKKLREILEGNTDA